MKKLFNKTKFFLIAILSFLLFSASMCQKIDDDIVDFNFKANGYYFVSLLHEGGASGFGHVGCLLISPNEFIYCSANSVTDKDYVAVTFSKSDYNAYMQYADKDESQISPAERYMYEKWKTMFEDVSRYNKGFYVKIDNNTYHEMHIAAMNPAWYHLLEQNCVHYLMLISSTLNPQIMNAGISPTQPKSAFATIQGMVNGTSFSNLSSWLKSISIKE